VPADRPVMPPGHLGEDNPQGYDQQDRDRGAEEGVDAERQDQAVK
jgi:hypothetical protein